MAAGVRRPCTGEADKGPAGDTKIRDPSFAAELAALDLERLLSPEIARLLFGQDFVCGYASASMALSFSRRSPHSRVMIP